MASRERGAAMRPASRAPRRHYYAVCRVNDIGRGERAVDAFLTERAARAACAKLREGLAYAYVDDRWYTPSELPVPAKRRAAIRRGRRSK